MPSLSFPSAFGGVYKRDPFGPNRGANGKAVHQPFKFLCSNASGFLCGSWPLEASLRSRIYRRMNLSPVQSSPLIRSRLVPQNKNKVSFSNGSRPYLNLTIAASPSIPLRRSDLPVARMSFEKGKTFSVSIF